MIRNIQLILPSLLLRYIKYFFLTGSVIFSLVVFLFILLNIQPGFSFEFLSIFLFLNESYGTDSFAMGGADVMKIFSVVSFVVMLISSVVQMGVKKVFNISIELSLKSKLVIFGTIISAAYVCTMLLVTFNDTLDNLFYVVFGVFYVINLISLLLYFVTDTILKKVTAFTKTTKVAPKNYIT